MHVGGTSRPEIHDGAMAKRVALLLRVAIASAIGCTDPNASHRLDGGWNTAFVPSGAYTSISLSTDGSRVAGTGESFGILSQPLSTLVIDGEQSFGAFSLTLTRNPGGVATYAGRFVDADRLHGTWTEAGPA